jgi:hypothetical protein
MIDYLINYDYDLRIIQTWTSCFQSGFYTGRTIRVSEDIDINVLNFYIDHSTFFPLPS